jgi:hypothetical protein
LERGRPPTRFTQCLCAKIHFSPTRVRLNSLQKNSVF